MATFMPGTRIGQVHGTSQPVDPATGARDALAFAMYHPAAALRTAAIERESYEDIARVPEVLLRARRRREPGAGGATDVAAPRADAGGSGQAAPQPPTAPGQTAPPVAPGDGDPAADDPQLTLF